MARAVALVLVVACGGSQQQKPPPGEPAYCGGCRYPTEADMHQWDNITVEGELVKPSADAGVAPPTTAPTDGGAAPLDTSANGPLTTGKTAGIPHIVIGKATLSRAAIVAGGVDRIVKTHAQQLQYCYEKEMVVTNDMTLEGKIMLAFEIDAAGKVATSTAVGLTPNAAKCMADRVATFEFPKPTNGTVHVAMTIGCLPTGGK